MKKMEADIAIISAGTAALAAAVAAAERGARVIIFEKSGHTGGTGNMGSHIIGINSELQRRLGIKIDKGEVYKNHMDYTHWRVDARLLKTYYDKSGSTIDWLMKQGVEFAGVRDIAGRGPNFTFTHIAAGGSYTMMKTLANKARELGVQIILKTPVKKILKKGGRIVGVIAEDSSGEEIQANAKAVIVATGGFGDNPEMIKKYTGYNWGSDIFSFRNPGLTGDGIRMVWEMGGARSEMMMQLIFGLPHPYSGPTGPSMDLTAFSQPNLMVNLLGERFISEDVIKDTTFGGNAISRQKGRCAFMIFDEEAKKRYDKGDMDVPFPGGTGGTSDDLIKASSPKDMKQYAKDTGLDISAMQPPKPASIDEKLREAKAKGYQHLFIADSLEDLCAQTGIDLKGLRKTVAEYNKACETGHDNVFEKNPKYLHPVKTPKFYAARYFPSAYGTLGGIKINYKAEVLDKNQRVIPGLYAGGVDANTLYGDSYTRFLYGNTQGFALNSGRIAAENALEYIKTIR
jgi:fumarate reductase flavoprotein subunit